ncbi:MAG: PIN/TRAM domain-containing protein, partial [Phycisphaerae bacterium]
MDVAASALVQSPIVIPRFVVLELQKLADSADKLVRTKGRRGLDMVTRLQRLGTVAVSIDELPVPGKTVDQMLIEFGRLSPGVIVTTDLALARIAEIQQIGCINMHVLANALKPALVPGEQLAVVLVREGEQPGQAVG